MLNLLFCLQQGRGFDIAGYLEAVIAESTLNMKIFGNFTHPDELLRFSTTADPNDYYLLFAGDGFVSHDMVADLLTVRAALNKMYVIFFSDDKSILLDLVNYNVMPSGFYSPDVDKKTLMDAVSHIYAWYRGQVDTAEQKFTVVVGKRLYSFLYRDIMNFEAREKKIFLSTTNNRFVFYDSLSSIETRLGNSFVRCHNSFIVNRAAVREINFQKNYIKLANGAEIPISATYKKNTLKILEYYASHPYK